jgi:hypothetical protein
MSSAYLHPEFGYFCPSPGLRRAVRIALVSAVIGVVAGASGAALISDRAPHLDHEAMTARTEALGTGQESDVSQSTVIKADASPAVLAQPDAMKPDTANPVAKSDRVKPDAAKVESATSNAGKREAVKAAVADTSCEANTWAYLDGRCGAGNVRKMRIVRAATAAGRNNPATAVAHVAPAAKEQAAGNDAPSSIVPKSMPASTAIVAAAQPQQPAVATKKPQKSASRPNHRRDQAARNAPPVREVRAQAAEPPAFAPFGSGGFVPLFR